MANNAKELGKCCFVLQQVTGVKLIVAYVFVYSLCCIVCMFQPDVRLQSGGYNTMTNWLQNYVGIFGVFFAFLGYSGVSDGKLQFLYLFNIYQWVLLGISLTVFIADLIALQECDKWAGNIKSQSNPNPSMMSISTKGLCSSARIAYVIGFGFEFPLNWYFTYMVFDYQRKIGQNPAHTISFAHTSQDTRHLAYYDYSIGEPSQFLESLDKPSAVHGRGYGTTH